MIWVQLSSAFFPSLGRLNSASRRQYSAVRSFHPWLAALSNNRREAPVEEPDAANKTLESKKSLTSYVGRP